MTLRHHARRAYLAPIGQVLNWILTAGLFVVPVVRSWDFLKSDWWVGAWGFGFLVKQVWDLWLRGSFAEQVAKHFSRTNSSLAGWIDSLGRSLRNSHDQFLGEDECRMLAVSLLARIREFAQQALEVADDVRIRVTLAVPVSPGPGRPYHAIRVWCYDQPYDDRRWTELPLTRANGRTPRGSPTAFVSGKIQVIPEVHRITEIADAQERKYHSVVSMPVKAGGPRGQTIAVLNIDATEPNFFTEQKLEGAVIPVIAPAVNLVALLLMMRRKEARYVFEI